VTGEFFDGYLRFMKSNDEDSQRWLWELLRDDLFKAASRFNESQPWAIKFDDVWSPASCRE